MGLALLRIWQVGYIYLVDKLVLPTDQFVFNWHCTVNG